jgi:cation:H+ antiporter
MAADLVVCFIGFGMLYWSAEWLVKGSSNLARKLGISPVVIGLTIVAFGTSAPELVVNLIASLRGKGMIAVGNVVGSNVCNLALVLGIASIFRPITSHESVIKRDMPIMLGSCVYLLFLSLDSCLSRFDGITLFIGIIIYTFLSYVIAVKESRFQPISQSVAFGVHEKGSMFPVASYQVQIILILLGISGVVLGARMVVDSAIRIMTVLGISERLIGLTIVAFGTSLPELATSLVAALKKEIDISIGNLVGSNIFNILCVLGATSIIKPISIPGGMISSGLIIDFLVMIFISVLPWLMMRRNRTLSKKGGLILLSCYICFIMYLFLTDL